MSAIEIRNRDRTIEEMRIFIKKVLVEPEIVPHCLEIARQLIDQFVEKNSNR